MDKENIVLIIIIVLLVIVIVMVFIIIMVEIIKLEVRIAETDHTDKKGSHKRL